MTVMVVKMTAVDDDDDDDDDDDFIIESVMLNFDDTEHQRTKISIL